MLILGLHVVMIIEILSTAPRTDTAKLTRKNGLSSAGALFAESACFFHHPDQDIEQHQGPQHYAYQQVAPIFIVARKLGIVEEKQQGNTHQPDELGGMFFQYP